MGKLFWFGVLVLFGSCAENAENALFLQPYNFDFNVSDHGWEAGFADYPVRREDSIRFELRHGHEHRPGANGKAMMLSGKGFGNGPFMFLKKKITGLQPNKLYLITFDVELASNAPQAAPGVSGGQGENVYLKVGAVAIEPACRVEDGYYRINTDKGSPAEGGADMIVIGNIATTDNATGYTLINRSNLHTTNDIPYLARTDVDGALWFVVGTDSAYEGTTTLYYTRLVVTLSAYE